MSEATVEAALREWDYAKIAALDGCESYDSEDGGEVDRLMRAGDALAALRSRGSSDTRLTEALREIVDAADGLTHVSVNVGTVDEHVRAIRMTTAIEAGRSALAAARADAPQEQA